MKRAAPWEEPQDVSSDDSLSSDSDDEVGKGKGDNAFGLPNSFKPAAAAEASCKPVDRGWGDHRYFTIIRGNNECGIEEDVAAGLPSTKNTVEKNDGAFGTAIV